MNNSAVYGGSIYHKYGNTIIRNTKFIDSYASLYGGVLATDGGDILIENCEFLNYRASGDAGGAIYSKVTNLTVKNANFTNGYADFGGAICDLNSDLIKGGGAALLREKIVERLKNLGFTYVALDLQGYRTGSLNVDIAAANL